MVRKEKRKQCQNHASQLNSILGLVEMQSSSSLRTSRLKKCRKRKIYSSDEEELPWSAEVPDNNTHSDSVLTEPSAFSQSPGHEWVISMQHEGSSPWCTERDTDSGTDAESETSTPDFKRGRHVSIDHGNMVRGAICSFQ